MADKKKSGAEGLNMCIFKSHKEVKGAKIKDIIRDAGGKRFLRFVDNDTDRWEMTDEWFDRHKPERGGYLVLYKDGYVSFSPAEAFEDGNTRITMNIQELSASLAVRRLLDGLTMFETENVLNHVMQMVQEMKQRSAEQLPCLFDLLPIEPLAEVGKAGGGCDG
jgi:hypothetical protein